MEYSEQIANQLKTETRRRLGENLERLEKCLSLLSDDQIWYRPNENTVSIGNLVLHLTGNVRQWILSGLGGAPDHRKRQLEFDETGPLPAQELFQNLKSVVGEVNDLLDSLHPNELVRSRKVQGFDESGLSIIVHVVEHFSYHIGQITYITKSRKNVDLRYYGNINLDRTGGSE